MADTRTLKEILEDDPFENDGPSEYDVYLNAALKLAFGNIGALTEAVAHLRARIEEHERAHNAATVAALRMPDVAESDKPN